MVFSKSNFSVPDRTIRKQMDFSLQMPPPSLQGEMWKSSGRVNLWVWVALWAQIRGVLSNNISSKCTSQGIVDSWKGQRRPNSMKVSLVSSNSHNLPKQPLKWKILSSTWVKKAVSRSIEVGNAVPENDTSHCIMSSRTALGIAFLPPNSLGGNVVVKWGFMVELGEIIRKLSGVFVKRLSSDFPGWAGLPHCYK